jgi:hypothetical protein
MKRILIVDDTQANLDAAKAFFSTIPGYEFVYVTNRKDAEACLLEVDALITDRSLPWTDTEQFNCEIPSGASKSLFPNYLQSNGHYLLLKSCLVNKPSIMATDHGKFGLMKLANRSKWQEDSSLEDIIFLMENRTTLDTYFTFGKHPVVKEIQVLGWYENLSKTTQQAWKLAWEEIQKQF